MTESPRGQGRRVLLINRFFFPDRSPTSVLLSDLAFALSQRDFRVTVITSRLRYDDRAAELDPSETVQGVEIRRVWSLRSGKDHLVERALEYLTFYLSAGFCLFRLARRRDVIVAKTDPPLLSVLAGTIARLRGARLINWLQDLFPEVAERLGVAGMTAGPVYNFLRLLRNRSLHSATANVVLGHEMEKALKREGIAAERINVISNWSDGDLIRPVSPEKNELRARWNLRSDDVVVGYVGNFGRVHDFDTILEAISLHQKRSQLAPGRDIIHNIVFLLVGGGPQRASVEHEIDARKLSNVRLQPYQPGELLPQTLSAADIHLVSLKPDMEGLIVPSKFYGIAAVARPTIFIGSTQGEIARLVEDAKCGITVEPGNAERLLSAITSLAQNRPLMTAMGVRARMTFEREWDKCHGFGKMAVGDR